jgi:hypothetical protein
MELLKKNMVSLACGVVALVAVAAIFWPIRGYYDGLRGEVEQRVQKYNEFKNILTKERKLPIPSPDVTEATKFDGFPTDATMEKAKAVVDKVKQQSQDMFNKAIDLNKRTPLVAGEFSDSPGAWTNFRIQYMRKLEMPNLQNQPANMTLQAYTIAREIMKAGFAPTEAEITAARDKKAEEIKAQAVQGPGGGGIMNQPQIDSMLSEQLPKIADEKKLAAAQNCLVYIQPDALDPSAIIMQPPASVGMQGGLGPSSIFNAQIGLWIYEDVAKAVAAANKGVNAKDVRESVVKHFVKFDVVDEPFKSVMQNSMGQMAGMGGTEAPPPPNSDPAGEIKPNFNISPTGRAVNGVYDVVPFDLTIVVDAAQIPRVLQELSRGRFITVTNLNLATVDSALKKSEGFYYGDAPVVELKLRCEALFLRKWTEPMMPPAIKQALGIQPQQPAQ